jgi:hypothetical protein
VEDDEILTALEPAEVVRAKVGQPGQWFFVRTAAGIKGYVAAVLVRLDEPAVVAEKVGQDRWLCVRTPSQHEGYVNGRLVRPMGREDKRKPVAPASVLEGKSPYICRRWTISKR